MNTRQLEIVFIHAPSLRQEEKSMDFLFRKENIDRFISIFYTKNTVIVYDNFLKN